MTPPRVTLTMVSGSGCALGECSHPLFSDTRLKKINDTRSASGKLQSACAELALLLALKLGPGRLERPYYYYDEKGKPHFTDASLGHISLSHAGDMGACAWAHSPVGVDIERADRSLDKLRARLLSPCDSETDALIDIWCAKESYVKLTGEGLARAFTSFAVENGRICDLSGHELACCQTGERKAYRFAVCAHTPFILDIHAFNAPEVRAFIDSGNRM